MGRFVAGSLAALFILSGGVLLWHGQAANSQTSPAPTPRLEAEAAPVRLAPIGLAPGADPKDKEEKRFDRADKNDDGRITLAEMVEPRRKPFAKLDLDRDGKLSFEEWAVKTIGKFETANADGDGYLTRAEYATTAPKPKAKSARCDCSSLLAAN